MQGVGEERSVRLTVRGKRKVASSKSALSGSLASAIGRQLGSRVAASDARVEEFKRTQTEVCATGADRNLAGAI
jgi:hypothetical protein